MLKLFYKTEKEEILPVFFLGSHHTLAPKPDTGKYKYNYLLIFPDEYGYENLKTKQNKNLWKPNSNHIKLFITIQLASFQTCWDDSMDLISIMHTCTLVKDRKHTIISVGIAIERAFLKILHPFMMTVTESSCLWLSWVMRSVANS